jgi:hypothetical protein
MMRIPSLTNTGLQTKDAIAALTGDIAAVTQTLVLAFNFMYFYL